MAGKVKGPAIFLAQFAGDAAPFNSFDAICRWVASLGYKGVQIPTWDIRLFDLTKAASSKTYCDELKGTAAAHGLEITELSTHLQGQLVAVNPAYDDAFDAFAPKETHGRPAERQAWAVEQMMMAANASRHLGLHAHATFSGALAWPYVYPWPQRAPGLIETAFAGTRQAVEADPRRNLDEAGVDVAYEIHPGEDIFDGATFERFLEAVKGHKRCNILYDPSHYVLQQLDYLAFIDIYHERIKAFHAKDAEFNPTGRRPGGLWRSYASWVDRAAADSRSLRRRTGRFRRHLLQDGAIRLFVVGGAGMGVLPEASRGRRARGRRIHRATHHSRDREGVRRLRRRQRRQAADRTRARAALRGMRR